MALKRSGFNLGIRAVAALRPHEQVIPEHVDSIAEKLLADRVQKDPILVDGETGTVLDGMHRLAAFQKLGIANAVCCSVDYSSRSVVLGRWARVYTLPDEGFPREALERIGFRLPSTYEKAFALLDSRKAGPAAFWGGSVFLSEESREVSSALRIIGSVDLMAADRRWKRKFVPEDEVDFAVNVPRTLVVLVQRITKEDVVGAARSGNLFPCKTSMHLVDPRPVGVDFPISGLDSATSTSLMKTLESREPVELPAGSLYEGRRYKERLLVLNE